MSKSKKSILTTLVAFVMLLALSVSTLTGLTAKADDPITSTDFVTGGTAYEPAPKTIENEGTISYTTDWTVTGGDLNADQRGPFSGAVLTANPGSSTFNLGTYDFSTADASKALIKFLPWSVHTATNGTDPYDNFLITFSSGEKSFEVKSYTRANGEAGIGVKGESQSKYIGLNPTNGAFSAIQHGGDTVVSYIMLGLDGFYGGVRAYGTETSLNASSYINNKRALRVPGIYINPTADDFWVYLNTGVVGSAYNNSNWFANSGHVLFGEEGSQYARYKVRDLKANGVDGDSAWTPFTTEELQNVTVTVKLEGLKEQSKFLVTEINGNAVTSVEGMTVINDALALYDGVALNVTDGIAKTITAEDDTINFNGKFILSDNDVNKPLAKVALFPKEYGAQAVALVNADNYTQTEATEFGKNTNGRYWKTANSKAEFNTAVATQDAKSKRDINALYLNFESESGKKVSVQLAYRGIYDTSGMPTAYKVKIDGKTDGYTSWFVLGGKYDGGNATAGASAIRFDGYVQSGSEYDEKGVQMTTKGALQDPVYTIYYNAEDNTLYADSGRINQPTWTNFGTEEDPLYRWKIVDFDDFDFDGFGDEPVSLSVTADLRDHDGDGVEDENANIMLMNIDGQALNHDGTNITAPIVESTHAYGFTDLVYAPVGEEHLGQSVKICSLFGGETEYAPTQYDMEVTGPEGAVTVDGGKFALPKAGTYEVSINVGGTEVGSYVVIAKRDYRTNAVGLFENTLDSSKAYYNAMSPKVATTANGLPTTFAQYQNKGIIIPLTKTEDNTGTMKYATTTAMDLSSATKDDALISFASVGSGTKRAFLVEMTDGTNWVKVYFTMGNASSAAYVNTASTNAYVQASGQAKIGGLSDGETGTFSANSAANGIDVASASGTPINASGVLSVYYDASEKAIYTDNASGVKTLVRDLDATDITNGEDTAFAGFTAPVTVKISHKSGGGYSSEAGIPTTPGPASYGVVVTTLNGLNLAHNGLGYLAGYNLTDDKVSKGAYVAGGEKTISVGDTYTIPALERVDGEALASGEADGWTTTVYNASKEDVTADVLVDNAFTATESGIYAIYRTKTVESTTTVVSETITARVAGFENEYANIFEAKGANDGMGKATVSFTSDLTTGESKVPAYSPIQGTGIMLNYKGAYAHGTTGSSTMLAKSYAHIPSIKISDNTASTTLVSATPLGSSDTAFDELNGIAVAVYEKADPTNYFVVTVYYFEGGAPLHAQAAATGQSAFGTRGATAAQENTALNSGAYKFTGFGSKEMVFSYDNANKAVYVNGALIRDFDANDNTNGTGTRVMWGGFKTDEVGVMLLNVNGGGRVVVSNIDGNDLSYGLIETVGGYTAGLETALREDNYNATTFANIGETVVVPAPTSKKITGDFVERTDITVAKVRVNGGEAVAYEKGVTSFTAVAGLNTIEYLDGEDEVLAKAFVKAYDKSLENEVVGGTAKQGVVNPIALIAPGDNRLTQHKGMGAATVKDGLLVSAQRPSGEVTEEAQNNAVIVTLDKKIHIGNLDADTPLVDFSHMPKYVSQQVSSLGFMLEDENGNTVKVMSHKQIPLGNGNVKYYGASIITDISPINVYVNGVKTQLRQKSSEWYTGGGFIAKGVYTSGYYPGHLAVYYDKNAQTLSVKGQSFGDNEILTHLNPSASDITTYNYPASRPCITLGDEVTVSFVFEFELDEEFEKGELGSTAVLSGKQEEASMLITTLAGKSLAQTNGVYANDGVKVARTVADDNNFYKVGDTVNLPAVTEYFSFWADGGVVAGTVDGYTVDVKDATGAVVYTDLAPNATFNADNFGVYTLVYKFTNRANIEKTIKVTTKTITLSANDATKITVDTTDNNGLGGALPNYTLTEGGYVNVKITPAPGYAITSAKIDGAEKITEVDLTGAQLSFMVAYADIANASNFEATLTAYEDITFTISYDANGGVIAGTAGTDYKVEYAYNDATFALPTTVTKTGYTFAGWFDGNDNEVEEIAQYSSTNYVLTARWTANAFTATFNSDGGSAVADQTIYYDGVVTEPSVSKAGYLFLGWFEDGATTPYNFDTIVTGDVELTAKWEINDFVVTFSDGIASQTISFGGKVTKPADPTKAGFTFGGWLYGATVYDFDTLVSSNMALTAIWNPANVTVTFDLNGGTGEAPAQSVVVGALAQKPVNPTKDGYVFVGWFIGDEKFDFGTEITANTTLTAKYVEVTEEVTPDAPEKESEGCGKEAVGLLAVVLSALAVVFVTKRK